MSETTCRLCLCNIEDMLDPQFTTVEDKKLLKQISIIFGFQINADTSLPQIVCIYCTNRVKSFYEYYQIVQENQETLQKSKNDVLEMIDEPEVKVEVFSEEIAVKKDRSRKSLTKNSTQTKKGGWDIDRINEFITFYCSECPSVSVSDFNSWKDHMKVYHDTDQPVFTCCETKLRSARTFLTHINQFHDESRKRPFTCAICLKEFRFKAQIEHHMKVHMRRETDVQSYQCKKCPETFLLIRHWRTHQLLHDPDMREEEMLYPCKKCPEELESLKALQSHLRNQHKKRFLCDHCAEVFHAKFTLDEHVRKAHTHNVRIHKCPECDLTFINRSNLKSHIKLLHTGIGEYPCPKCPKIAITEKQLMQHMSYTHQLDRNFRCEYCSKAFKRINDLEDHRSVHTGISRHSCPKCGRKFNSKSNMQSHAKRCKDTNPFNNNYEN